MLRHGEFAEHLKLNGKFTDFSPVTADSCPVASMGQLNRTDMAIPISMDGFMWNSFDEGE